MKCEKCNRYMDFVQEWHLGSLGDFEIFICDCGHVDKRPVTVVSKEEKTK